MPGKARDLPRRATPLAKAIIARPVPLDLVGGFLPLKRIPNRALPAWRIVRCGNRHLVVWVEGATLPNDLVHVADG